MGLKDNIVLYLFTSCSRNYAVVGEELRLLEHYAVFIGRLSECHRCFGSTCSLHILLWLVTISPVEAVNRSFQQNAPPSYSVISSAMCTNPPAGRYLVFSKRGKKVIRSVSVCSWDDIPVSWATRETFTNRDSHRHSFRLCVLWREYTGSSWRKRNRFLAHSHPSIAVLSGIFRRLWGTVSSTKGTRKLGKRRRFPDPNEMLLQFELIPRTYVCRIFRQVYIFLVQVSGTFVPLPMRTAFNWRISTSR